MRSTPLTRASSTLTQWIDGLLPFNGITKGTVTLTGLSSSAGTYQWLTRREILDAVCRLAGAEWAIRPNFSIDAAAPGTLFRQATPQVVVTRKRGGPEGTLRGMAASLLVSGKDASRLSTKATVVARGETTLVATGSATQAAGYVTPANGTPDLEFLVDAPSVDGANANTHAAAVLASAGSLQTTVSLSTRSWLVPLWLRPGDWVWAYDLEAGLFDAANQLHYRGELITPAKVRCHAITWPIEAGMGVYVRRSGATPTYLDVTDWVELETEDTHWEIGTSDRAWGEDTGATATLGENASVVDRAFTRWSQPWGTIGYAEITTSPSTFTTIVDISGLSVTFTAVANRRYRITAGAILSSSVANDVARIWITNGSNTQLQAGSTGAMPTATIGHSVLAQVIKTPSAGSITYKVRAERAIGTGNITLTAGSTVPAYILVEDIGPNGVPA